MADHANASRDDILWYYRSVLAVVGAPSNSPLVGELARTIEELEPLIGAETGAGAGDHRGIDLSMRNTATKTIAQVRSW